MNLAMGRRIEGNVSCFPGARIPPLCEVRRVSRLDRGVSRQNLLIEVSNPDRARDSSGLAAMLRCD
jgi:hypothetical protein